MKIKHLFVAAALMALLCSCGSSNKAATEASENEAGTEVAAIDMQTDPLIIELENFEGRRFEGERSFIALYDNKIKAQIPTVVGMVRTGMSTGAYALTFNQTSATISKPRADKKGKSYSFSVLAKDGSFFGTRSFVNWRMNFTVYKDGRVSVYIDSDEISRSRGTRTWWFSGTVNESRTEAAKLMKASDPFAGFPND